MIEHFGPKAPHWSCDGWGSILAECLKHIREVESADLQPLCRDGFIQYLVQSSAPRADIALSPRDANESPTAIKTRPAWAIPWQSWCYISPMRESTWANGASDGTEFLRWLRVVAD